MELRDLIVTPLVVMMVYAVAYVIRPYATDKKTQRYFIPALTLKMIGAVFLGVLYQFYYNGGDTFYYHTYGSRVMWDAFMNDFFVGLNLFFSNDEFIPGAYKYIKLMSLYQDAPSFAVIRIATVLDLFTYSTYSATAILFSLISFSGSWAMFVTFYRRYRQLHFQIAIGTLFIPSVVFWGSGILKDTIVLAALGYSVYCIDRIFILHRVTIFNTALLLISLFLIYSIKKFILQAFIPSAILWIYFKHLVGIRSTVLKIMIAPLVISVFIVTAYYSVIKVGEGDTRYSIEQLAKTAQVTAYDIRYWTGGEAGSGYSLGELDGTFSSMFRLAPQAINVSLFRPYLWEVKNPLMLLSALEGFVFLALTIYVIAKWKFRVLDSLLDPNVVFCLTFSIAFAFAVGISTFNFGTLARYKIPLLPFYFLGLVLMGFQNKTYTEKSEIDDN